MAFLAVLLYWLLTCFRTFLLPGDEDVLLATVTFDPGMGPADENFMVQGTSEAVSKLGEPLTKWDFQALKRRDQMWNYLGKRRS